MLEGDNSARAVSRSAWVTEVCAQCVRFQSNRSIFIRLIRWIAGLFGAISVLSLVMFSIYKTVWSNIYFVVSLSAVIFGISITTVVQRLLFILSRGVEFYEFRANGHVVFVDGLGRTGAFSNVSVVVKDGSSVLLLDAQRKRIAVAIIKDIPFHAFCDLVHTFGYKVDEKRLNSNFPTS